MTRLETYCQVSFVEAFFDSIPDKVLIKLLFNQGDEGIISYYNLFNILFRKSFLCLDDLDFIAQKAKEGHPYFKRLLDISQTEGGSKLIDLSNSFNNFFEDEQTLKDLAPSALCYFSQETNGYPFGFFIKGINSWKGDTNKISQTFTYKVHPEEAINTFLGWDFLAEMMLPINAAIIADPYILKNSSAFETNLFDIIENLLPERLAKNDFHLTIIAERNNENRDKQFRKKFNEINSFIQDLNHDYKILLSLYIVGSSPFHDRNIITNYFRLHSGQSFNYYNDRRRINKESTLSFFGLNAEQNVHQELLEGFKLILKKEPLKFSTEEGYVNRLLG